MCVSCTPCAMINSPPEKKTLSMMMRTMMMWWGKSSLCTAAQRGTAVKCGRESARDVVLNGEKEHIKTRNSSVLAPIYLWDAAQPANEISISWTKNFLLCAPLHASLAFLFYFMPNPFSFNVRPRWKSRSSIALRTRFAIERKLFFLRLSLLFVVYPNI